MPKLTISQMEALLDKAKRQASKQVSAQRVQAVDRRETLLQAIQAYEHWLTPDVVADEIADVDRQIAVLQNRREQMQQWHEEAGTQILTMTTELRKLKLPSAKDRDRAKLLAELQEVNKLMAV